MSSLVFLATAESALADVWERQLSPGQSALRLAGRRRQSATGFSAVVVLDATAESLLPAELTDCPTIYVGEPRSLPFEQAKLAGRARVFLSYEESATKLRDYLPLVGEIAEKQSLVALLTERSHRGETPRAAVVPPEHHGMEWWSFLEGAVESLDSRERLIAEFRRASRFVLRASRAVFFLRTPEGFSADRDGATFGLEDPLVSFFEQHPMVVDGMRWPDRADPVAELAVRNRLVQWGARMLVPVHDDGWLSGLIALGVREDGQPYEAADHARGVFFARLLRHCLGQQEQLARLQLLSAREKIRARYLPGMLVLGPDENVPRHVPLTVREAIAQARRSTETVRRTPTPGQPYRVSAGKVAETDGTWATWEEASADVVTAETRARAERRALLRDLALTLSHELGNALVSLATFRQSSPAQPLPAALLETVKTDVSKLESLNRDLELLQAMHEADAQPTDLREVVRAIGEALGLRVQVGDEPVTLPVIRELLEFALRALAGAVAENQAARGAGELALQLRSTGLGAELTALIAIRGSSLELEGVLPEPTAAGVPTQGRIGVFLAKEILRLHRGELHAGPGLEGTEILISLRGM